MAQITIYSRDARPKTVYEQQKSNIVCAGGVPTLLPHFGSKQKSFFREHRFESSYFIDCDYFNVDVHIIRLCTVFCPVFYVSCPQAFLCRNFHPLIHLYGLTQYTSIPYCVNIQFCRPSEDFVNKNPKLLFPILLTKPSARATTYIAKRQINI